MTETVPLVNKSLYKALNLLACFTEEAPEWTVSDLSRRVGIGKSSVSTMLSTLARAGLVRQSPTTRRYGLGLRCLELGYLAASRLTLRDYAYPFLEELLGGEDRIVYLAIPYQDEILYVEALYPPRRKIKYSAQGRRGPMYCTGIGKAALAFMPTTYLDRYLERTPLRRFTPHTIVEPEALRLELERVRARGYATDRQEHELGIQCVGAPIRAGDGRVLAAVSLSSHPDDITEERFEGHGSRDRSQTGPRR
jgi:IclR family KDG regulon transcriptional repressor